MPDIDGFEVCRRLREDEATKEIPILHISASCVESGHRARGLEGGADAYLSEPINQDEFLATVKALLRMRHAQREAALQRGAAERAKRELEIINLSLESRVRQRTTELEHRTQEVQELSISLLQAQDDERRRISRELHDSTGQLVVALKLNLERLKSPSPADATDRILEDTTSLVDELSRQLRTMSYLLHPPLLDEAGLPAAVRWYVEGFSARSDIAVTLDLPDDLGRLPQDLETTVFRMIQESLTNIHRHSGSSTAAIRLSKNTHDVSLEITDQGKGFEPVTGQHSAKPGVGILGMKERVRRFGGTMEISSSESGTCIRADLPLNARLLSKTA
jgi:signal transduction histidine kinase